MTKISGWVRRGLAAGLALGGAAAGYCPGAMALNQELDVSQYAHTAWKTRDGFAKSAIKAIAQTPDGYLWLGTESGLLRFDGVRAVPWQPPDGQVPFGEVRKLLTSRDGTLWIGTFKGLASWKAGKLIVYHELDREAISALLEDREGTVWVASYSLPPPGKFCGIRSGTVQCYAGGETPQNIFTLFEDKKGNLWAGGRGGIYRWKPGPPKFYPITGDPAYGIRGLAEDMDGALLVGRKEGIWRFVDGKYEAYPMPGLRFNATSLLRDRDGNLWIATFDSGLVHVHKGQADVFGQSDGLSSNSIGTPLFEDREGNIWVATLDGLDRFREFAVAIIGAKQGLPANYSSSVLADKDGSVWVGASAGLYRWKNGELSPYDKRDGKINGRNPLALFQDASGKIWVSTHTARGEVLHLENNRFVSSGVPGQTVFSIAEDKAGNLWMSDQDTGLFRLSAQGEIEQIPWTRLGHKDPGFALAVDPLQRGLWIGFYRGGLVYFADGQVRAVYTEANGLGHGEVNQLRFGSRGTLWAATEGGLSRIRDGHVLTLTSKNGLPCDGVLWSIEDDEHFLWLNTPCGLVRIARAELDGWVAAMERDHNAKPAIQATVFDISDGIQSLPRSGALSPRVAKAVDGKLWFTGYDGVSVVDPRRLPYNKLPPPVHIEQITADRKTYDVSSHSGERLRLPALSRDLEIDYTALSLAVPEKVRFRTKLEGWDREWQDVGTRRQAFYTGLGPRNYQFRVMACNNSGVWNEAGATLDFAIAPAYYQTMWFRLLCVAALAALVWGLYQYRLRQLAREFNMHLEGRVSERTRIARELHDTLLQSFQGVLLSFHAAKDMLPGKPEEAKKRLEYVIDRAAEAVTEGRNAVQGLRSSTKETNDLAAALNCLGVELAAEETNQAAPVFRVEVEGEPRDLHPILRDEVYRITGEAMRNAFRHAQASRVEVEIRYDARKMRVRIRDDGKGIEPQVADGGGRAGHWGLRGMRERAKLIGGELELWSDLQSGTEIELTIPASNAYATAAARGGSSSSSEERG